MPLEATETTGDGRSSPKQDIKNAQNALDDASRLGEQSRLGQLEEEFVRNAQQAGEVAGSDSVGFLLDGLNSLVESLPPLVRALDAIAQVHPFLAVAVGAFKVVIELEVKRRDNDKKVNLLFLEMRNMMAALLQLQGVRPDHAGWDGLTVGVRLEDLVKKTAREIKECANACDAYARKRLLAKVFKAPSWEGTLKEYIQLFNDRKNEFCFRISIHTGQGVDSANAKLDVLTAKIGIVFEFFRRAVSREERVLAEAIRQAGGADAVLANPNVLQELLLKESQLEAAALSQPESGPPGTVFGAAPRLPMSSRRGGVYFSRAAEAHRSRRPVSSRPPRGNPAYRSAYPSGPPGEYGGYAPAYYYRMGAQPGGWPGSPEEGAVGKESGAEMTRLMRDLADEPAVTIKKNLVWFERKFMIQQREIVDEMTRVVVHQGDRVISSVLAGPHERIVDPDMYAIWKDMRWRGIVKARHLILAIHDYYMQRFDDQQRGATGGGKSRRALISDDDVWAIECLDLMHLQPVIEAFDNDASGFVTIQEVNYFTTSRPQGWSLLHWLAYWAVGWQVSMTEYKRKIRTLLARMRKLQPTVRGRELAVRDYLGTIESVVRDMTVLFRDDVEHQHLLKRFQKYTDQEEARLRVGLETAKYDLDALDTLALINGPRGLERNLFVILYLVLRRHYDVMRLGRKVILHPEELSDAAAVITLIKDAHWYRGQVLMGLFAQRRLLVPTEMSDYACGMMSLWQVAGMGYSPFPDEGDVDPGLADDRENQEPTEAILKYPAHLDTFYPESEDGIRSYGVETIDELRPLLGHWAGVQMHSSAEGLVNRDTFSLDFHPSPDDPAKVIAIPLLNMPWICTRATVTAEFAGPDDKGKWTYTVTGSYNTSTLQDWRFNVTLNEDNLTLEGEEDSPLFSTASSSRQSTVIKKNSIPEVMIFYPTPSALSANRAAARWRFAISAVLDDVRRHQCFSWAFIKERRDRKQLFASLLLVQSVLGDVHTDDKEDLVRIRSCTVPADIHYFAYASVEPAKFPWILPWCTECKRLLRTVDPCLRCVSCEPGISVGDSWGGVAICGRGECLEQHTSFMWPETHRILKTRVTGWRMAKFSEETGVDTAKLEDLEDRAKAEVRSRYATSFLGRFVAAPRVRTPPSNESPLVSPHPLSTISEGVEGSINEGVSSGGFINTMETPDKADGSARPSPAADGIALQRNLWPIPPQIPYVTSAPALLPSLPTSTTRIRSPIALSESPDSSATLQDITEGKNIEPVLRCVGCQGTLDKPCWVCAECPGLTYVCGECDECGGVERGEHARRHTLLQIRSNVLEIPGDPPGRRSSPSPTDTPAVAMRMGDQLADIEGRCERTEERIERFESRLDGLDGRLVRIDDMLSTILSLLRGGSGVAG
ncbi:hypothetical protein C8Q78DRAFT_1063523 [Trametes maxima]|nr:hypothetical protein C8Q78DRAFT_1063523 [Trametes maxima]